MMAKMKRWTDEKLDRELALADNNGGDCPYAKVWLDDLRAECVRRWGDGVLSAYQHSNSHLIPAA